MPRLVDLVGEHSVAAALMEHRCDMAILRRHPVVRERVRATTEWVGIVVADAQARRRPPQVHQARVRAVEEGLPLVRAANNGISAAVDGYGRILARLDLDARGTIDVALPAALAPPPYARLGDLLFLALWLLGAAGAAFWRRPWSTI